MEEVESFRTWWAKRETDTRNPSGPTPPPPLSQFTQRILTEFRLIGLGYRPAELERMEEFEVMARAEVSYIYEAMNSGR